MKSILILDSKNELLNTIKTVFPEYDYYQAVTQNIDPLVLQHYLSPIDIIIFNQSTCEKKDQDVIQDVLNNTDKKQIIFDHDHTQKISNTQIATLPLPIEVDDLQETFTSIGSNSTRELFGVIK